MSCLKSVSSNDGTAAAGTCGCSFRMTSRIGLRSRRIVSSRCVYSGTKETVGK